MGQVIEVFERNFRDRGELGASVSIWWDGEELINEGFGWCEREEQRPWTTDTLVPVYSATKVPSATTLLMALHAKGLDEKTLVREVWEKFPVAEATFAHLLSHQCGLSVLDQKADVLNHEEVVAAVEAQAPAWAIGEGHGYHPRTFGVLVEEPVRRLTGMTVGQYWRENIADVLDLDFWIGLPEEQWSRVAKLYPGKATQKDLADGFYKHMSESGSFTRKAFSSPRGLHAVHEMNEPRAWTAGLPALGGVGTASALAKFYQALIGGIESPVPDRVKRALMTKQSASEDKVLLRPTVFTCGAQMDPLDESGQKIHQLYGSSFGAFGHPGAGGSHAFGDPETGVSFAYTMNQMNLSVMPGEKCVELVSALFEC